VFEKKRGLKFAYLLERGEGKNFTRKKRSRARTGAKRVWVLHWGLKGENPRLREITSNRPVVGGPREIILHKGGKDSKKILYYLSCFKIIWERWQGAPGCGQELGK